MRRKDGIESPTAPNRFTGLMGLSSPSIGAVPLSSTPVWSNSNEQFVIHAALNQGLGYIEGFSGSLSPWTTTTCADCVLSDRESSDEHGEHSDSSVRRDKTKVRVTSDDSTALIPIQNPKRRRKEGHARRPTLPG